MSKKLLVILAMIICISLILSYYYIFSKPTQLEIIWSNTFDMGKSEEGYYVLPTEDEGGIVLGYTTSYETKNQDILVIKISKDGNKEWEKNYGGIGNEYGKAIIQIDDGYIITGTSYSNDFLNLIDNALLIKIDFNGNIVWNKTYGGIYEDGANSLVKTEEGDYVITGFTESYGNLDTDLWIFKVNTTGDLMWTKTFGGIGFDQGRSIVETNDGFVIAGQTETYSKNNEYSDAWIIKVDNTGEHIWNYTFDGLGYDDLFNQIIRSNDGFIMVGNSLNKIKDELDEQYYSNGYIVLTDKDGKLISERTLEEENETGISSIVETDDGYLTTGYIGPYGTGEGNITVEKIDNSGERVWFKEYGGDFSDAGVWIDRGTGNNYFVTGYQEVLGDDSKDLWIAKLELE